MKKRWGQPPTDQPTADNWYETESTTQRTHAHTLISARAWILNINGEHDEALYFWPLMRLSLSGNGRVCVCDDGSEARPTENKMLFKTIWHILYVIQTQQVPSTDGSDCRKCWLQLIYGGRPLIRDEENPLKALTVITISISMLLNGNDQTNGTYSLLCWNAEQWTPLIRA